MRSPRGLTAGERAAWERLARTVVPLVPPPKGEGDHPQGGGGAQADVATPPAKTKTPPTKSQPPVPLHLAAARRRSPPRLGEERGLDSTWDRKLRAATLDPDFTLDLHGLTLDRAHARLDHGLTQAKAMGARLVLLVTGKPRPVEHADRGERRGAIRAKVLDWLAAGPHGGDIAAVRNAHRRHGGEGALYIVLRRGR